MQTSRFRRVAARGLIALACCPLWAAPSLTTIQDVLYRADGTKFDGQAVIEWKSFTASDLSNIAAGSLTLRIVDGVVRVQLVPTASSTPATSYSVRYNADGKTQFTETWSVPVSAASVKLSAVRVLGGSSGGVADNVVEITEVEGLEEALEERPIKGPGYTPSGVVMVTESGLLETVTGEPDDCLHVDGTSGSCLSSAVPGFADNEVPGGTIDGANQVFTLTAPPVPESSLLLYRNGLLQKSGYDFTLSGATITFVEAATPQTGDVLLASYRISSAGAGAVAPAQVLCIGNGDSTSATTAPSLGQCEIASGLLTAGDRIEIRFDLAHAGAATAFTFALKWGDTTLLSRAGDASETLLTGRGELGIHSSGAQWSTQNWGGVAAFAASVGTTADTGAAGVVIDFLGTMAATTTDTVTLRQFTVLRYPSQ